MPRHSPGMHDKKITVIGHLEELRVRIIKSLIVISVVSCYVYSIAGRLLAIVARPVGKLIFTEPAEAFLSYVKIALWGGLILSSPFVIYQLWQFISAGLKPQERKYIALFGPFSFVLFAAGGAFGYCVIIPVGIKLLLSFSSDYLVPMISVSNYISFVGMLVVAFGIVFQLPLLCLFLTKTGIITPTFLTRKRRHAIVIIFIVAAALTPPDIVSQFLMAIPLLVLYELGILLSKVAGRRGP